MHSVFFQKTYQQHINEGEFFCRVADKAQLRMPSAIEIRPLLIEVDSSSLSDQFLIR